MPIRQVLRDMCCHLSFKHFVITRFGLGQRKDDFFELNIEYLEKLLSASLKKQTVRDFVWLVLIDVRAPDWVFERLENIINGVPRAKYIVHDPFKSLNVAPDISDVLEREGVSFGEYIVTTRVDSDDALSVCFIKSVNSCVADCLRVYGRVPVSVNPVNGMYYYPEHEKFFFVHKNNYSVQTIGSAFDSRFVHPHSGSHKSFSGYFRDSGWPAILLDPEAPLWLRSMRKDSNVHQNGGIPDVDWLYYYKSRMRQAVSRVTKRPLSTTIKRTAGADDAYRYFSFSKESQDRISLVERTMWIKDYPAIGGGALKRWQYKKSILEQYINVLQSDHITEEELERCHNDLINRYYAR